MKPQLAKQLLGAVAATTLAGLLIAPSSGWLVKMQIQMASGMGYTYPVATWMDGGTNPAGGTEARAAQAAQIAARNPSDTALHMAAQAWKDTTPAADASGSGNSCRRRLGELRALLPRFGSEPLLHAALLRYMSGDAVSLGNRPEQDLLSYKPNAKAYRLNAGANLPENLALWEKEAQAGERSDPHNAYFPLMHAVGLFAAHRDDEALFALQRASEKPHYTEYLSEETEGQWHLMEQAQGEPGYLARTAVQAAQMFPHYALVRAAARLATVKAMQAEMAGEPEKGFQIRMALNRVGAKMRTDSKPIIGTLVGDAIAPIAWGRPGGAAPLAPVSGSSKEVQDKHAQEKLDGYCAYLTRIGHADAIGEVRFEREASLQTRSLWRTAENNPDNILELKPLFRVIALWAAGVVLLANALLVLLLGTLATFLTRTHRVKNNLPLHPAVRIGLAITAIVPVLMAFAGSEWLPVALLAAAVVPLSAGALALVRRARASEKLSLGSVFGTNAVICFATMGVGAAVLTVLGLMGSCGIAEMLRGTAALLGSTPSQNDPMANPVLQALLGAAVSLGTSLLLFIGLAIHSRKKRVPVSVGAARGFRRLALPVAAGLILVYAGVAVQTLRYEARAKSDMQKILTVGEGRYLSDLTGNPWPGRYEKVTAAK